MTPEILTGVEERSELLRKTFYTVADLIEGRPDLYDQEVWGTGDLVEVSAGGKIIECPSNGCICGHTAAALGCSPTWDVKENAMTWTKVEVPAEYTSVIPSRYWLKRPDETTDGYILGERGETTTEAAVRHILSFGLEIDEFGAYWDDLFSEWWSPRQDLSVPEALRLIADGATVESVSEPEEDQNHDLLYPI